MQTVNLQNLVVIDLLISGWTNSAKLKREDVLEATPHLPPEELSSVGSIHLIDPKTTAAFRAIKTKAERKLASKGVRFLNGVALPEAEAKQLIKEMRDEEIADYYAEKDDLINGYEQHLADNICKYPDWAEVILAKAPSLEYLKAQIQFRVRPIKVAAALDDDMASDFLEDVESLPDQLLVEIEKTAQQTWEQSFSGRETITRRALRPVKTMRDKLNAFAWLNGNARPLVAQIDATLQDVPVSGPIVGELRGRIDALVLLLSDRKRMLAHAKGLAQGVPAVDLEAEDDGDDDFTLTSDTPQQVAML